MIYYRARYYDPTIGRFVQRDPIGLQGGINQYAYADNSPTNYTDPQGTQAFNNSLTNFATFNTSYFGTSTASTSGTGYLTSGSQSLASVNTVNENSNGSPAQTLGAYSTYAVLAVAAGGGPEEPVGDVVGAGILAAGTIVATSQVAQPLLDKMATEIQGITQRNLNPEGEVYSLRATLAGDYPNVRGGTTFLNVGDVYKYGETTQPDARYSVKALQAAGLEYQTEFRGSQMMSKIVEKQRIYGYFFEYGALPPGNRIFR